MIKLSESAIEKIKTQLEKRGKGLGIRLGVKTTGCSGLAYVMEFADKIQLGDSIFDFDGCKILIDSKSLVYLNTLEVDYVKKGLNEGFEFNNSLEKSRCGCGMSFKT